MMSKTRRDSRSSFTGSAEPAEETSKNYSYSNLCRNHFRRPNSSSQSSRKNLTLPLLTSTPDEETDTVVKIWRNIVRFTTEAQDSDVAGNSSTRSLQSSLVLRQQSDTASTSSSGSSWNTIRLKQLRSKLRQGLRRSSASSLFKETCSSPESSLEKPFEQVQYIIGRALIKPILRDEIYCIILRQLNSNPQKSERFRGWVLLNLVVSIFLPSDKIFLYVARFIDDGPSVFSSNLKKLFVCLITDGPRHQPPSYVEYMAAMDRKPMELQVTLMDGSTNSIGVDSSVTSSEIISNIAKSIDLQEKFGFSLFITMENRVTSLGSEGDKVFDAISQCEQLFLRDHPQAEVLGVWRLFMRKEMFSPWDDAVNDPVATNLIYAQITRGVLLGEYVCDTDSELVTLAAKQYYCEFENDISEAGLVNILSNYIPPKRLSNKAKLGVWAKHVAQRYRKLFNFSEDDEGSRPSADAVKVEVVNWAKAKWSALLSRHFDVRVMSSHEWCDENCSMISVSIRSNGVSLMTEDGKKLLQVSFSQISSICGEGQDQELKSISGDVIVISLLDGTVIKLETIDANVIYRIVTYCTNGLRERSIWALAIKDYNSASSTHLDASEGDLIRLEQPAKQEALTSLTAACTNMTTLKGGRIRTELLYVIATLEEPTDKILLQLQSDRCQSMKKCNPDEVTNDSNEIPSLTVQIGENEDGNE